MSVDSTLSHTPGPWVVVNPHPGQYAIVPAVHASRPETWTLAYVRDFQINDEANARLIAAAPDLLTAAIDALTYIDAQPDATKGSSAELAQCGVRYQLRQAIFRATKSTS